MRIFDIDDRTVSPPPPTVTVNGAAIADEVIEREMQNHPADSVSEARDRAAEALVVRELLLQQAHRLGIRTTTETSQADGHESRETEEDALVRALITREVPVPTPTEEDSRRFYAANRKAFIGPPIYEAAHILFSADTSDPKAAEVARSAAAAAIAELEADPGCFAELARAASDCPSAEQGGNLGQISPGQTSPAFEAALEELQPGAITPSPVTTPYGFHVIRLHRRIDGAEIPFSAARARIDDYLADRVFHRAVHQYVAILAGRARIEGIDIERAMTPLVQ